MSTLRVTTLPIDGRNDGSGARVVGRLNLAAEDLARWSLGKLVDPPWVLVSGQVGLGMGYEVVGDSDQPRLGRWRRVGRRDRAKNATLCIDSFHVVSWATDVHVEVRREVWNTARHSGMKGHATELQGVPLRTVEEPRGPDHAPRGEARLDHSTE